MAKPKFYLEPRKKDNDVQAINMFYSFNGYRLQYYTGIRVNIKSFRPESNKSNTIKPIRSTSQFAESNNNKLMDMAADAVSIVSKAKGDELNPNYVREQLDKIYKPKTNTQNSSEIKVEHTFLSLFEKIIDDTINGKRLINSGRNSGSRYTRNTYKNYKITLSAIKRYMRYNNISTLLLDEINRDFYEDFRSYCYNVENKEKSTFGGYIKDIKTIMVESNTPHFKAKDFIIPSYEADTLYLTDAQIDKIAALDFSNGSKIHTYKRGDQIFNVGFSTLEKVRDLFLIGAWSGQRFSDFNKLDVQSIDGNFIKLKQLKTGNRVAIPIMSKLRHILNKYPDKFPTISNQKFNEKIKVVAELAGLTENRKIINTKGNIESEIVKPLYSMVSSHCCRRSYATNMFKAGVPPMLIMSATSHRTETSFLKYIRATNDDKAKLLAETLSKLGL